VTDIEYTVKEGYFEPVEVQHILRILAGLGPYRNSATLTLKGQVTGLHSKIQIAE
jgi:hypothetical protein